MAQNNTISRKVNYEYATGASAGILPRAFPLNGVGAFTLQIFVTDEDPAASAKFYLLISNDDDLEGANFARAKAGAYEVVKTPSGGALVQTCFILAGNGEGVCSSLWVQIGIEAIANTGKVSKVIFSPTPL